MIRTRRKERYMEDRFFIDTDPLVSSRSFDSQDHATRYPKDACSNRYTSALYNTTKRPNPLYIVSKLQHSSAVLTTPSSKISSNLQYSTNTNRIARTNPSVSVSPRGDIRLPIHLERAMMWSVVVHLAKSAKSEVRIERQKK